MKEIIEPKNLTWADILPHLEKAIHDIKHYTAQIVLLKSKTVCSGTFVSACGFDGILTAYHVARPVLEDAQFGLCIAEYQHALFVRSENCQHVVIGRANNGKQGEDGPDLSFIIIRDTKLLGILRSLKSFCNLDRKDLEYFQSPLDRMTWFISGNPHEATKLAGISKDGPLMVYQNFIGESTFHSRSVRDGFDFIQLKVTSGQANFPNDCEGMSGGGMWLVPFTIESADDIKSIRHEAPLLAGVSFYQSEAENGERTITGHGYESIYTRLRQTLRELN